MKNVAYKTMGQWILVAYGENPPTDPESHELLDIFKTLDVERTRVLIVTKGGAPTAAQRKDFNDLLQGRVFQVAVVCDLITVRGIVTAMSWFNSGIKSFTSAELDAAMRYVGIPQSHSDIVRRELAKLQSSLGKPGVNRAAG